MASPVPVFVSSATEDGDFCRQLDRYLGPLKKKQRISVWFEGMEELGSEAAKAALEELERASLIVLLVSADFLASEEERCWEEMERALARHREGEARVMPVILRACGWRDAPFAEMRMRILPERPAGRVKAITSWRNRDEAFTQVTDALRALLEELGDEKKDDKKVEKKTVAPEEPVLTSKPSVTYPAGKPAASAPAVPAPKPVMGPLPVLAPMSFELEVPEVLLSEVPCPAPRYSSTDEAERRPLVEALDAAYAARESRGALGLEIEGLHDKLRRGGRLGSGDRVGNGRYKLLERLGRGGFADVFHAFDLRDGVDVAIKVLHSNQSDDEKRLGRFLRGARYMSEIEHPGIVRILERDGIDCGYHYFVMEYAPGGDLRNAVMSGKLGAERVGEVILEVGEALSVAHDAGVVHRDVKPANIVLDAAGKPKLTDFDLVAGAGTSAGTKTGAALGSLVYAAPECVSRPRHADARADVFGLGMTAIFCYRGKEIRFDEAKLDEHREKLIAELWCSEAVREVLRKAVREERSERYDDVASFCEALRAALAGPATPEESEAEPEPPAEPVAPKPRRVGRRFAWGIGGLLLIGAVVWGISSRLIAGSIDNESHSEGVRPTPTIDWSTYLLSSNKYNCGAPGWDCYGGECISGACQAKPLLTIEEAKDKLSSVAAIPEGVFWLGESGSSVYWVDRIYLDRDAGRARSVKVEELRACAVCVDGRIINFAINGKGGSYLAISANAESESETIKKCIAESCWRGFYGGTRLARVAVAFRGHLSGAASPEGRIVVYYGPAGTAFATGGSQSPAKIIPESDVLFWLERGKYVGGHGLREVYSEGRVQGVPTGHVKSEFSSITRAIKKLDELVVFREGMGASQEKKYAQPIDLASDDKFIYWANLSLGYDASDDVRLIGKGQIYRLPIENGVGERQPEPLVKEPIPLPDSSLNPRAIAVDDANVYWTSSGEAPKSGVVLQTPKTGGSPEVLAKDQHDPRGIAVDDKFVYWANRGSGQIMRVRKRPPPPKQPSDAGTQPSPR